ncbi:HepT-like ribonuclease domain-containing protein [Flavobacterium selenitireducens]|uniref:HepT-like ribonuclease domain-containing protein n=1 Tax=Flavobacterium selenitireducens TaxID=2722704 RepID=UPI00168A4A43|nr:HepT-like ribonuclease domain-containing protein [Flavobacterium selenitireducens]MBD3584062.1 DUF86 domain-containing protein [Flavobacterium selenitireducens]
MTDKGKKYLSDILMAIELIEEFTAEIKNFNIYDADKKTQSAVERQLAIIGEALNHFRRVELNAKIENDKQIIAFRNRLIHAYDNLDNSIIWAILSRHLKPLKTEVENLLR